jgi:hypothetical protein
MISGLVIALAVFAALGVLGVAAWWWGDDTRDPGDRDALRPRPTPHGLERPH